MKKNILGFILLLTSLFIFNGNVNADFNNNLLISNGKALDRAFGNTNIRNNIDNIFIKIDKKNVNQSIQKKIYFYKKLLIKIKNINTNYNYKLKILINYIRNKINYKINILENQNNNSDILNNIFGKINNAGSNNSNNNINTSSNQTYKIQGEAKSIYLPTITESTKRILTKVKLGMFDISSSDGKAVRFNNLGIKLLNGNGKGTKLPSIKYIYLYDNKGTFIKELKVSSTFGNSYKIFNIPVTLDLNPGKYTIVGDISDIENGETIIVTQLAYSYSLSNLVYKQINFGKVSIKKINNN